MTTASMQLSPEGHPHLAPNQIAIEGDGFYVSYNNYDTRVYGCDTTALVWDRETTRFYILNGDHRNQYAALVPLGFNALFDYFERNIGEANRYSEKTHPEEMEREES